MYVHVVPYIQEGVGLSGSRRPGALSVPGNLQWAEGVFLI